MTMTADQLEHSAETHRTHITELLDELRERATPGEVVDDLLGWDVGRQTLRTLGAQVRENPLPLALIGIGVTWLLASDAIGGRRRTDIAANENAGRERSVTLDRAAEGASRTVESVRSRFESAGSATADATGRARAGLESARDSVSGMLGSARDRVKSASSTVEAAQSRARGAWQRAMNAAGQSGETLSNSGATMSRIVDEQPLLLGGLSFVLGLAAGAALPMTELENDLFGEVSDQVKDKAKAAATDTYEDAKRAAQTAIQGDGADASGADVSSVAQTRRSTDGAEGHSSEQDRATEIGIDPGSTP